MGALNQPSPGEIERRRAAWALTGLGWLFVCLAVETSGIFWHYAIVPPYEYSYNHQRGESVTVYGRRDIGRVLEILRKYWDESLLMPLTGAAAGAAFVAAKGLDRRRRWAKGLGAVVAVFATLLLPLALIRLHWRVSMERPGYGPSDLWHNIGYHELLVSALCLFLGVSARFAIRRMESAAPSQSPREEAGCRHAAWALAGLGWVFVFLMLDAFDSFFAETIASFVIYEFDNFSFLSWITMYIPSRWDLYVLIPLTGAAAFAAFLAVKGLGCRQRWALGLGAAAAVFAAMLLPLAVIRLCRIVNLGHYHRAVPVWSWIEYPRWVLSALCLFLGVAVLCTIIRMWIIGRNSR